MLRDTRSQKVNVANYFLSVKLDLQTALQNIINNIPCIFTSIYKNDRISVIAVLLYGSIRNFI